MKRIGVVVHPSRPIDEAMDALRAWVDRHEIELVQIAIEGREREIATPGEATDCDLLVAIGGDGTTLAAIRKAVEARRPVLGVACGSLGVLTTIAAEAVQEALERFADGDWRTFEMPALHVELDDGEPLFALNDLAVVRSGEGQLRTLARVDGALYGRFAGDGCIVSTPIGSSAYALAAGGPLLAPGVEGLLLTPVSPHGGFIPPLVVAAQSSLSLELERGHGGARLELDGQVTGLWSDRLTITLRPGVAQIVRFPDQTLFIEGLRERRIIADSPRIVADDERGRQ